MTTPKSKRQPLSKSTSSAHLGITSTTANGKRNHKKHRTLKNDLSLLCVLWFLLPMQNRRAFLKFVAASPLLAGFPFQQTELHEVADALDVFDFEAAAQ